MFRVLLLILVLMSSTILAQTGDKTPPNPIPEAIKFVEFSKATNGYVKMQLDGFMVELNNNPFAQGYIIIYGSDREAAKREKQIRNAINFRKYDATRITIVRGGIEKTVRTVFWIVPESAEPPTP